MLTDFIVMQARVLRLDLVVLVSTIENVGIGRTRDLGWHTSMLFLGVPDGNAVDDQDVRSKNLLWTKNPDACILSILAIHDLFVQIFADTGQLIILTHAANPDVIAEEIELTPSLGQARS